MVQWNIALMTGLLIVADFAAARNDSIKLNSTSITTLSTPLKPIPNTRNSTIITQLVNSSFTTRYNLMRKYLADRERKSNLLNPKTSFYNLNTNNTYKRNSSEKHTLLDSPHLYDILKTNISKLIRNVINQANRTSGSNNLKTNEIRNSLLGGNIQNTTLPPLSRTFRSNYENSRRTNRQRSQLRRQRNDQRDRNRHSTRVFSYKPANFLLPPYLADNFDSKEKDSPRRLNENYKWSSNDQYPIKTSTEQPDFNTSVSQWNRENLYQNELFNTSETQTTVSPRRRKTKNYGPSYVLKPPIITFTTTDFFYVTPKIKIEKLQQAPIEIKPTSIDSENSVSNFYDLFTTTRKTTFDEKYYAADYNENNQYQNSIDSVQNRQSRVQNWTPLSYDYNITSEVSTVRSTTDSENLITQSVLNDENFGLRNLSLFYLNDENYDDYNKSNSNAFKNNYYLPNTSATVTVSTIDNIDFKLPEYQPQYVPIHDINSMTTTKDYYYDKQDEKYNNEQLYTAVPLLSRDVEKAGMKIYKLTEVSNNMTQNPWYNEESGVNNEIESIIQSVMAWKERYSKDNENYEVIPSNSSYSSNNKDTLLTAAETTYYKSPTLPVGPVQQSTQQQNNVHNSQVIPGSAGQDYPTLSKAPISSRYSCKNDGRRFVADKSTGCQVFIMCNGDGPGEPMLCPNGTLFSQDYLVCDWWYNVDCH